MNARTLVFPADRSVGEVNFRTDGVISTMPAQGDVEAPPDKRVQLVFTENVRDLNFDHVDRDLVASVVLRHRKLGDGILRTLTHFEGLLELRADDTSVTDEGLAELSHFPLLQILSLRNARVTDAGLTVLANLGALTDLTLSNTRITGEALAAAAANHGLRSLHLAGTRIDGDALRHITQLFELRMLDLCGTRVTDDHVAHLRELHALTTLLLRSTTVTPEGIVRLPRSPNLMVVLPQTFTAEDKESICEQRPDLIVDGRRRQPMRVVPVAGAPQRKVVHVSGADFDDVVLRSDVPVLVDFWADWCQPCKQLDPVIDDVARKSAGVFKIAKVDTEEARGIAERYGIMSIPTLLLFAGGDEILRFSARSTAEIVSEVRAALGLATSVG